MDNTQPKIQLTLKDTNEVRCEKCENTTFTEAFIIRKASALLTGSPKDSYIPIPVFICSSCGSCNDEFIPNELKNKIVA